MAKNVNAVELFKAKFPVSPYPDECTWSGIPISAGNTLALELQEYGTYAFYGDNDFHLMGGPSGHHLRNEILGSGQPIRANDTVYKEFTKANYNHVAVKCRDSIAMRFHYVKLGRKAE